MAGYALIASVVLGGWLLQPTTSWGQWDRQQDEKSIAELELMNDAELAFQADSACRVSESANQAYTGPLMQRQLATINQETGNYLRTIELVVRKHHQGTVPQWMKDMDAAFAAHDSDRCMKISLQQAREEGERQLKLRKNSSPKKNTSKNGK